MGLGLGIGISWNNKEASSAPDVYSPPTNLSINQFLYRQFRLDWTNTSFTGSIESIKLYLKNRPKK